ncbi:MAG TPA: hypothetical protein VM101_10405 [Flavitalea sp.]|nr:hypothetical protein [Flavitalea sp.]
MNPAYVHKKFIFNEKIEDTYIHSLYEHDYAYIAEVFSTSLETLKEETGHFTSAFESSDIDSLKKAAHKIKPLFGFTGMLHHQEMMGRFEHLCENTLNTHNITIQYIELTELMKEGKNILKEECNRLTEFIS